MRASVFLLSAAVAASTAGCSEPRGAETTSPAAPDAALTPVVVQPGFFKWEGDAIQLLADGDVLPIRLVAQGGFACFIGARVSGLGPGPAKVYAELVAPTSLELLVSDSRVVELAAAPDGTTEVEPDALNSANFSHLVACPNYSARPVHGEDWILNLTFSDPENEALRGSASVRVTPTCAAGSRFLLCLCDCEPGYVLGKCGAN